MLLQLQDLLFNSIAGDELVGENFPLLTNAVSTVDGLCFHCGVPPGIEDEDVVGFREVETQTAGLDGDQENFQVWILIEFLHLVLPVVAGTVEVGKWNLLLVQKLFDNIQVLDELTEHKKLVTLRDCAFKHV